MKNLTIKHISRSTAGISLLLILLTIASVMLYPQNLNGFARLSFILTTSFLFAYLIFCLRIPAMAAHAGYRTAFEDGSKIGFLAGIFNIVHLTVECFVAIPEKINSTATLSFMCVLFILFGVSAYITGRKINKTGPALLSGIWCAMVSILILFVYGFLLDVLFFSQMKAILRYDEEFIQSKMALDSFVIHNTLESGGTHLLEAPFIALIFSLCAVLINRVQVSFSKK